MLNECDRKIRSKAIVEYTAVMVGVFLIVDNEVCLTGYDELVG